MRTKLFILSILLSYAFQFYAQNTIKIDGFFDDWNSNISTYVDDSLDSQGIELLEFSVCNDNEYLYVKIKLSDEIDITEPFYNPAEVFINIDADNNSSTGYYTNNIGSEYGINFFGKFIFDDTNFPIVDTLSLYNLDIIPLPTYSSDEFEIAINRSLFSDTICISIREKIGNDFMPDNGSIFTYIFDNCSSPSSTSVDFLKNDSSYLRLMTYNVRGNGLINNNRVDEHRRIFASANADIITFQECGNTTYNDVLGFLNTSPIYYPYIYPDLNSGNLTISKYPSLQSWQVTNKIDAELIDLPDSIYSTDILILNGHPPHGTNNQGRQENFDAFIQFIQDAKTVGGVIDLPINTPISFSGDMNLVGYSEQYYTIVNGTISDTSTYGSGGFPDWDNTPLKDQVCYFNEKEVAFTWDESNPSVGDFPPGRLDFVFFTNSVMSVDKSFIISTEHMSPSLLSQNNLLWNDTKIASDHFPVIVDFVLPSLILKTKISDHRFGFNCSPNPSKGIVNINKLNEEEVMVKILNVDGQLLQQINMYSNELSLDMSAYPKGMYFIQMVSTEGICTRRVLRI
ncbi:T9SS type A sorting domain-containing protein [Aureispira]|nr:T9SS type A sorting domain-containing protein [Aureispira sp.]